MARAQSRTKKKKEKKNIPVGVAHIKATFNNTLVTITDPAGNVVSWSRRGSGIQGTRKGTPFAAQLAARMRPERPWNTACETRMSLSKGRAWAGRRLCRALQSAGLSVNLIRDVSPIPHWGCAPPNGVGFKWRGDRQWLDAGPDCRLCRREGMQLYLKGDRCYDG